MFLNICIRKYLCMATIFVSFMKSKKSSFRNLLTDEHLDTHRLTTSYQFYPITNYSALVELKHCHDWIEGWIYLSINLNHHKIAAYAILTILIEFISN